MSKKMTKLKKLKESPKKVIKKTEGKVKAARTESSMKKLKEHPRSYRLDPEILDELKRTLKRINEIAPKKVSEARLIKALILMSKEIEDSRIIKALKEIW